jgi:hypothetical protein
MAKQSSLFLPRSANNSSITLVNADGTTPKLLFTAGADDTDVDAIIVTSNDTSSQKIVLYITRSAVDYLLSTVNVPNGAGTDAFNPSVDLLAIVPVASGGLTSLTLNNMGKQYLRLKSGDTLKVATTVAITAAKTVWISAFGQDY